MTIGDIRDAMVAENDETLRENDGQHVVELWNDGEITMTKGGSLYGQRSLHQLAEPVLVQPIIHPKHLDVSPKDEGYDPEGRKAPWAVALPKARCWELRGEMIKAQYEQQMSLHNIWKNA